MVVFVQIVVTLSLTRLSPLPDLVIRSNALFPVELNPPKVPRILWNSVKSGMLGTWKMRVRSDASLGARWVSQNPSLLHVDELFSEAKV